MFGLFAEFTLKGFPDFIRRLLIKKKRYAMNKKLTAIIEREGNGFVSLCPELDVASQGNTIDEAKKNLQEALELFFETASPEEVKTRLHDEVYVTQVEVTVG
jgi:predicted RNase H-like HicB family nuclease